MLNLRFSPSIFTRRIESVELPRRSSNIVVCAQKGPRQRYPRVWKTKKKIGTISKSVKLVECVRVSIIVLNFQGGTLNIPLIFPLPVKVKNTFLNELCLWQIKELSNVKEEVYGALDSFIAWELEFPLITVKKALKILENNDEWKRIIQVTKWMLSKGQGKTMGSYYTLLNALAEDGRIDEAEELWAKLFSENLESTPRIFFDKMVTIYYNRGMHDKMFEIFADMEELGMRPNMSIVSKVGDVFQKLGMLDKYKKLKKKYPPPKWEYQYIKGKRVKVRTNQNDKSLVSRRNAVEVNGETVESYEDASAPLDENLNEVAPFEDFKESVEELEENVDFLSELRD